MFKQGEYCCSRMRAFRRKTHEVLVGSVGIGGGNPIRIQSMTTTDTKDVAATVGEAVALAEAGCEIIRVTAPNVTAARSLKEIRKELRKRKIDVPLVADIHFLPAAAMEAVEHVEKIRINPGNYADRKKFAVREYTDAQYNEEIERLYEDFSPLVKRCKELGRSMRIGTNHGSLSDRIMNRYGDTPLGMVESALEFTRIAEAHNFRQIIFSMKASNPKVMIQAYRLLVKHLDSERRSYPIHLGVTEAGDGEDGRIKSAIGIGSLLADGVGDTVRVSLTEDPVYEIPVARALAAKAERLWKDAPDSEPDSENKAIGDWPEKDINPYTFTKRTFAPVALGTCRIAPGEPPRVIAALPGSPLTPVGFSETLETALRQMKDTPLEGLEIFVQTPEEVEALAKWTPRIATNIPALILRIGPEILPSDLDKLQAPPALSIVLTRSFSAGENDCLESFIELAILNGWLLAPDIDPREIDRLAPALQAAGAGRLVFTLSTPSAGCHAIGSYRLLVEKLRLLDLPSPIWIRNTRNNAMAPANDFLDRVLESSILTGSLLCDGIGDLISVDSNADPSTSARLAYSILQGAGARITRTEFVACPSCGRTLFNLQSTTQRIREKTSHLKGVKIAIMGCIVNGPGEMADADFGYVGGAPGKVNLYVGKKCVRYHVPEAEADMRLIELIKAHGKWREPEPVAEEVV